MSGAGRILLYVQHLLGVGHLHRTAAIARALQRDGFDVMLVSGGYPDSTLDRLDGIRFAQLPPTRAADASFRILLDQDGTQINEAWWAERRRQLIFLSDSFRPEIVLTELFPFARRPMRHELLPWLEHLRQQTPRPLVFSSVRDILVDRPKPARDLDALTWFNTLYDGALIHGDPALLRFESTFPLATQIAERLTYTGYIVERSEAPPSPDGRGEVLVSAGGGAVGMPLFQMALAAKPLSGAADLRWRFFVSPLEQPEAIAALRSQADDNSVIDFVRADFPAMLRHCRLSISKAGYNTVMETLHAGARAVVVPFAGGDETEQALRAELLAATGAVESVRESDLTPMSLAAAIGRAMARPDRTETALDLHGAEKTAAILRQKLAAR